MAAFPQRPKMSRRASSGRITSADWMTDYAGTDVGDIEFKPGFFDVEANVEQASGEQPSSAGASAHPAMPSLPPAGATREASAGFFSGDFLGGPLTRSRSTSQANAALERQESSTKGYPPMPPLTRGASAARGLSTDSWFDPKDLPLMKAASKRSSTRDFIMKQFVVDEPPAAAKDDKFRAMSERERKEKKRKRSAKSSRGRPAKPSAKRQRVGGPGSLVAHGENDVLMGRGGLSNHHVGNKRFRALANSLKDEYIRLDDKDEKTVFSNRLVDMVHQAGGRFLVRDQGSDLWVEADRRKARKKASQALREQKTLKLL